MAADKGGVIAKLDRREVHVLPTFGRAHVASRSCWCRPQPDRVEPLVLVHRLPS